MIGWPVGAVFAMASVSMPWLAFSVWCLSVGLCMAGWRLDLWRCDLFDWGSLMCGDSQQR